MHPLARILLLTALLGSPAWASGDFVILAREPDPEVSWAHTATVWRLDEKADAIVPVARLEKSHWSPNKLHPSRPDLLRLQIPDPVAPRAYSVALYHINRADSTVREVWRGIEAHSVFEYEGAIYIRTIPQWGAALVSLRFLPGTAEPEVLPEPFEYVCPVTNDPSHHIILREGVHLLYDATTRTSRRIGQASALHDYDAQPALSPDGSHLAYFVPGEVAASTESEFRLFTSLPTSGSVVLLDLSAGDEHRFDAWVYTTFSSGRVMLAGPDLTFDHQGRLHFQAIPADRIPRGKSAKPIVHPEPLELSRYRLDPKTKAVEPVPSAETVERFHPPADDGHDTAWTFLHAQGVEAPRPTAWMNTMVGFDQDRTRFLLKCSGVGLDDTFFLADTAADTLARIPTPPALVRANDLNIIHIPSPAP